MNEHTKNILDHSLEYAKDLLDNTGEFYPFGAFIDTIGQVHPLEMEIDKNNVPNNGKVIEALEKYCKGEMESDAMIAYGITFEAAVKVSEEKELETICVSIVNKEDSDTPDFYLPYKIANEKVTYDEIFAVKK